MRKAYFLLFAIITFVACEEPTLDLGNKAIRYFTVSSSDWQYMDDQSGLNNYYMYSFPYSKLEQYICDEGSVQAYLKSGEYQQALPIVRHHENSRAQWTTTTDYEYRPGEITFFVTNSDFIDERPESMTFRVVLMW